MSSARDKRHVQAIEKALASFDLLDEWADYIAFLSRLQKALLLDDKPPQSVPHIPQSRQIANKLAVCLSSKLPNGVHQKALGVYDQIFLALTKDAVNSTLQIWLPGLLPLLSYCLVRVKPEIIALLRDRVLAVLRPETLKPVTRPLILSLLPGLDDENSETFADVSALMDSVKAGLHHDSHFWLSMFLCVISSPERRLGALYWCNKRMPIFTGIKGTDSSVSYSKEAQACLFPEPGLLIRAFATAINTSTSFNPAGDIIVVRGFFDLLLSHLPLHSDVLASTVGPKDKELLVMACCSVTLKKDMSLNRRLWNWLLGPDSDDSSSRSDYFAAHSLEVLLSGLLKMVHNTQTSIQIDSFRISLSLIIDKWELSHLITPRVFAPILLTAFEKSQNQDVLAAARAFLDGVEASYIWNDATVNMLLSENESQLELLEFLLKNFDLNEEDMVATHIPLAILAALATADVTPLWLNILDLLVSLAPLRSFPQITPGTSASNHTKELVVSSIKKYYHELVKDESTSSPFSPSETSFLIVSFLREFYVNNASLPLAHRLSNLFCSLVDNIPNENSASEWSDASLVTTVFDQLTGEPTTEDQNQSKLISVFNITKLLKYISNLLSPLEKSRLLKVLLSNLWTSLVSSYPANFQVEAVKYIFDLDVTFPFHQIEAGILNLLLQTPPHQRVRAFSLLWTHSLSFSDADKILVRPLQLILDDLYEVEGHNTLGVIDFIKTIPKSGSANRLLKLITNPLLNYELMQKNKTVIDIHDDLNQFSYYLKTIANVIRSNEKAMKESFNSELAVMDSEEKLNLIKSNDWDIATYKSLVFHMIEKFFRLKLDKAVRKDQSSLTYFFNIISTSLELLAILITGNEPDFADKFHLLIETCSYYTTLAEDTAYEIELIEAKFLKCIFHFLKVSEDLKVNLNLLHVEDEDKDPLLVRFIINGIDKAQSSILLENWFHLLTRSLYLFNESIFSVLLTLNDAIVKKIDNYFEKVKKFDKFDDLVDVDSSMNIIFAGLEDLLSISHSYLLTSALRADREKTVNQNGENGFFGSVIQGVFQIESPAIRTSEQNKLYSILISFQDAANRCFSVWKWADSKPQVPETSTIASERSLTYLSHKLKFRARKLLETLMELERQEVIETLVDVDRGLHSSIKLLHVLDGGRSQVTLPHLLNSITSRCHPQTLGEKDKSSLNVHISAREIAHFLLVYVETIDNDTIFDVWEPLLLFFKDVLAYPSAYRTLLPEYLRVIKVLSAKLGMSKLGEQRRYKKELADVFTKVLSCALTTKGGVSESDSNNTVNDLSSGLEKDELMNTVTFIIEHMDNIVQDSDKLLTAINSIIATLVSPLLKVKGEKDIPELVLRLLDLIGKFHPTKTWKSLVSDIFNDNSFFGSGMNLKMWKSIISTWISDDKEKISELIGRVTPTVLSTATNIFIWNEGSEVEGKVFTLRRISYLLLIQPENYFLSILEDLFGRLDYSLNISSPSAYRSEICTLLRAITLKFSELHLLPYWVTISHQLASVFDILVDKNSQELGSLAAEDLTLILKGCKLLDQLLLLKYDEFNLTEWLFVSSQPDVVDASASKGSIVSIIDGISTETDLLLTKDDAVKVKHPDGLLQPLLYGVGAIPSIASLRTFFASLSFITYERTYGLFELDMPSLENDIYEDLTSR